MIVCDFEALRNKHLIKLSKPVLERCVNIVMHLDKEFCCSIDNLLPLALSCEPPEDLVSLEFIWRYQHLNCEVLRINFLIFFVFLLIFPSVDGRFFVGQLWTINDSSASTGARASLAITCPGVFSVRWSARVAI